MDYDYYCGKIERKRHFVRDFYFDPINTELHASLKVVHQTKHTNQSNGNAMKDVNQFQLFLNLLKSVVLKKCLRFCCEYHREKLLQNSPCEKL